MTAFFQDLRHAARILRKSPGFALVAISTLALAIGANTAVFSFVHAALLRALPYPSPERLVVVGDAGGGGSVDNVGFATFQDLRDGNRTFAALAAIRSWQPTLAEEGDAERLPAMRVSWNYFAMLGVRPALGRDFLPEEDRPETWRVLLLSDSLWRRRFGADPSVLGRVVRMNDRDFRIVGVLPASFEPLVSARYYKAAEIWAPLGYDATLPYGCRSCQHLKALGRLRAGVTRAQARADLDRIRRRLAAEHPADYPAGSMGIVPLREELSGGARPALLVLSGAVGFVLLIACANVANLLLARALRRSREIAIRSALGAGRWRLMRQLLAESLLLAAAGGAVGTAVASASLQGLSRLAPASLPRLDQVRMDPRVLGFAALVSLATGLLFGLVPALKLSRPDLRGPLSSDSVSVAGGSAPRARRLLVVADLALALMLLAGAGLMLKTLGRLLQVDPGFRPDRVLSLQFSLIGDAYAEDPAVVALQDRLLERVRALPGVEWAALAGQIPLGGNGDRFGFHVEGRGAANPAEDLSAERYSVTPDYFRVMGIALARGRLITAVDRAGAVPVVVISETTARRIFPAEDPLGRRVRIGDVKSGPWRTIVGIVGDVRHADLAEVPTPQMYLSQAHVTDSYLVLTVKAATSRPETLAGPIRRILRDLDPGVPIYDVATMNDRVSSSVAARRFVTRLLAGFAGLAVILAAIGLYGVISYALGQRTREIGVRIALGASRADILRLVLGSAAFTVIAGLAGGLAATLATTRLLRALLFEVSPYDPATLALAVAALAAVALAAHWLPARRASKIDPMAALRAE